MKRKAPTPVRRVPVDFGDELWHSIPVGNETDLEVCATQLARVKGLNSKFKIQNSKLPVAADLEIRDTADLEVCATEMAHVKGLNSKFKIQNSKLPKARGFTLVEILVVMVLLSLIIFALMEVFTNTQRAFRASLTAEDSLENGRAVMNQITSDLEGMTPCDSYSNSVLSNSTLLAESPVNFSCSVAPFNLFPSPPSPLFQPLITSPTGAQVINLLENIFILGKGNVSGVPSWIATGYSVTTNLPDGTLYPLYRFYMTTNESAGPPGILGLYNAFNQFQYTNYTVWSHFMDGVVNLTVRTYDTNGVWMTNGYANPHIGSATNIQNVAFFASGYGEVNCVFFSNAVPASVQVELGTLEDRALQHAEGLVGLAQSNYLSTTAGQVHLFRQRVWIRNLDPTAYQ